jgi:hypothetical protein
MALNIDLGQQSQTTINAGNVPTDQNLNVTLGANGTLIVDGVDITISNILGVGLISNTTLEVINGAHVTVAGNVGGIAAGSHLSYDIGANSSVTVQAGLLNVDLLNGTSINFNNTGGTGQFTLTPAAINLSLSTPPVVTGLSNGDKLTLSGATSASLSNGVLTFHYPGLLGLDTISTMNLQGIPAGSSIAFDSASNTVVFACRGAFERRRQRVDAERRTIADPLDRKASHRSPASARSEGRLAGTDKEGNAYRKRSPPRSPALTGSLPAGR